MTQICRTRTSVLDLVYEQSGPLDGRPVMLLHGYPYDVRAFDAVVPILNAKGYRTIVPYLRGYGGTKFLLKETPRSGEQAAIGQDLLDLLDALRIERAIFGGFDWGARAACVVSALWPQRALGLVTCAGYLIQDIAGSAKPLDCDQERRYWYQYYFHTRRGYNSLKERRAELAELLWKLWSPAWTFDEVTFRRTAASFENEDFVDVVVHSYRHRTGEAAGDPRYADIEARLARRQGYLPQPSLFTVRTMASLLVGNPRAIDSTLRTAMSVGCCRMSGTIRRKRHLPLSHRQSSTLQQHDPEKACHRVTAD